MRRGPIRLKIAKNPDLKTHVNRLRYIYFKLYTSGDHASAAIATLLRFVAAR